MKKKPASELKVGIITVIFCVALYVALTHMGVIGKKAGKTYRIQFSRVGGIGNGASVRYAGVEIGKVCNVEISPAPVYQWDSKAEKFVPEVDKDGKPVIMDQAFITFMLTNPWAFAKGSVTFTDKTEIFVASSIMGDKWIEIRPKEGTPLKEGEVLKGLPPTTIEDFIAKTERTVDKMEKAIDAVNNVLGDPETQKNIKLSLENFKDLTGNLKDASNSAKNGIERIANKLDQLADNANRVMNNVDRQITAAGANVQSFTGTLNRIALTNEGDIRGIVKNLVATSKSLHNTLKTVEKLVSRKEFSEDILTTLHNVKQTSEQIVGIASDVRAITSDGQLREDLKTAVREAKETAEGANKLIKGVNKFLGIEKKGDSSIEMKKLIQLDADAEWNQRSGLVSPNVNMVLLPQHRSSLKMGMDSLGYGNYWNLQYRAGEGTVKPRVGVIRSKLGIGSDFELGKSAGVYVDAYDPTNLNVDVTGKLFFGRDFYLLGGARNVFQKEKSTGVFGAGKRF